MQKIEEVILLMMLAACAADDMKQRSIPVWMPLAGFAALMILSPFAVELSLPERCLGFGMGLVFLAFSVLSGGRIGTGDGILLCVTGFALGLWDNLLLAFYGLAAAAVFCMFLLALGKATGKSRIPLVPFLCVGFLQMILLR